MRVLSIFFLVNFFVNNLFAQLKPIAIGAWRSHFDYSKGQSFTIAGNKIYFAAQNGLFVYDIIENEHEILGLENGLSNLNIGAIEYHSPTKTLLLAYTNGMVDLAKLNTEATIESLTAITSIKNSNTILGSKNTNNITFWGNIALLSTDFGLVQIDLISKNIKEIDKNLGENGAEIPILSSAILNNEIYLISTNQLLKANLNGNLQSFETWQHLALPSHNLNNQKQIFTLNNTLFLLLPAVGLFEFSNNKFEKLLPFNETNFATTTNAENIYIALNNSLLTYNTKTKTTQESVEKLIKSPKKLLLNKDKFWLADAENGLISNFEGALKKYNPTPTTGLITARNDSIVSDQTGLIYTKLGLGNGLKVSNTSGKSQLFLSIPLLQNNSRNSSTVNSIAVDKNNIIYLAVNGGVVALNSTAELLNNQSLTNFISTPVIDGVRTLANEVVLSIAVDGGNRKWIGTASALYLFNDDLSKIIEKFTTINSPLPANKINFLNLEPSSGELFIYTDSGVVSYRTNSSESTDIQDDNILVFPNPVLPHFSGLVGISGLVANATVKITDIAGRLVYKTQANGGTASWDLTTKNGQRAESGIYFIFSSNEFGKEKLVTKLAVVK